MQTPIDAVFEGFGFDTTGNWHSGELMDYWRWGFSDLVDGELKSTAADLIVKMLLQAAPDTITADERMLLRMGTLAVGVADGEAESGYSYDA